MHILVWLKKIEYAEQSTLLQQVRRSGVIVYPIDHLYTKPKQTLGLMMGYATLTEAQILEGIITIKETLNNFLPSKS